MLLEQVQTVIYRHVSSGFRFKTKPWKHQLKALQYLHDRSCGALYTDMGTGKTKVMIDLINNKNFSMVLIVCPLNVCSVWVKEFNKHSLDTSISVVDLSVYSSVDKITTVKKTIARATKKVVCVVNYDSVWRRPFREWVLKTQFDCIICDESHRIKSPSSKASQFLALMAKRCDNRYLMTGTPLAQEPSDIYAQYRFLDSSIFGTNFDTFRNRYENLDVWRTSQVGYRVLDEKTPYKNLEELHNKMFSVAINAKSDIKLPDTMDEVITFKMSPQVNRIYHELMNDSIHQDGDWFLEVANVLALSTRLQQLTSGYVQLQDLDGNTKLKKVDDSRAKAFKDLMMSKAPDEPIVIFAKYRVDLNNIKEVCDQLGVTYSEVSGSARELQQWQDGKTTALIVQIQSGSEGIDLTRARYAVYYTQTWSLSQYLQSRKRIHRPGQERSVVYYHLVAELSKGTSIDQKIYKALKDNESLINIIMRDGKI